MLYMESRSSERVLQNASTVRRALWPMTGYGMMRPILSSNGGTGTMESEGVAGVKRGSWWGAYSVGSSVGSGRSSKRRRSRAVAKPPITQLSAQDKAHFKRIVQLFTGLGSSSQVASHHLLLSSPSKPAPLASLLLSNTSPSSSSPPSPPSLLPPPLSSPLPPSLPLSHPNNLHLDIISSLCSPISTRATSSLPHSHIAPPPHMQTLEESVFLKDLKSSLSNDTPSPSSTSHDTPKYTSPNSTSISNSLGIPLHSTPKDTHSNPTSISSSGGEDLTPHVNLQSNGFQALDTLDDADADASYIHSSIGVSCSINDDLHVHVGLTSFAYQLHDITKDTSHNTTTSISYNGGIDCLSGHMALKSSLESHLNGTSPGDIMPQESMVMKELSSGSVENKAQVQVKEPDKQVNDLESFLLKENDKVDNFFSLVSLFLEQSTPKCDILALS